MKPDRVVAPSAGSARPPASMAYKDDYPRVLEHMANGRFPTDGWVTHIPMDDLVEEGIKVLRDQRAMKIMVDVGS